MLPVCLLSLLASLSLGSASTPSSRMVLHHRAPNHDLAARQVAASTTAASVATSSSVPGATSSAPLPSATAAPTPWTTAGVSPSKTTTTAAASTPTAPPNTWQSIKDALKPSHPLYPVAIGSCVLIGLIPFLFLIAFLKWFAHRAPPKEYCSHIGSSHPTHSPIPSMSSLSPLVDKEKKPSTRRLPTNPPEALRKPGPPIARTSLDSTNDSPFDPRSNSIGSLAETTSWGYSRQPSHHPRSLRPSFYPSFSSPASSIHREQNSSPAPSLRHPSLYVATDFSLPAPSAPPTPSLPAHFQPPSPRSTFASSPAELSPRTKPSELFPDAEPYVRKGPIARSLRAEVEEEWGQGIEKLS